MNAIISKLLNRASDLADVEPTITLFLAAALLAVFLAALFQNKSAAADEKTSLIWTLYRNFKRWTWAVLLVALFVGTISVLRSYLRQTVTGFQRTHGRVTEANLNAARNKSSRN